MSAPALAAPEMEEKIASLIPLGRVGKPEEIAAPIVFLCTPLAGFITGEVFNVNGGAVLVGYARCGNLHEDERAMTRLLLVLLLSCACGFAQNNSVPAAIASPDAPPQPDSPPQSAAHATAATSATPEPTSQKARQLLDDMVTALGGQAWLTYRTVEQQGRSYSFFQGRPSSAGTLFWRFYEYPDKERRELTKQRDVVYIYNGEKGYEKTFKGTAADEDKDVQEVLRRRRHSLEVWLREWIKDPKTVLFYDGQSVADQQMVDVVTILNRDNDQLSIGIDIHTHLPINKRFAWRDSDKYKVEDETIYGNYRNVQGIQTPFTVTYKRDGEINGQSFLSHAAYNNAFAPGFFDAEVTYNPETYNPKAKRP